MQASAIVDLYWQRSDEAIVETDLKYGNYCRTIAYNILHSHEDTEECVDDTYMGAWNSMPDKRPQRLSPFLAKITRNFALNRITQRSSQKRGGGETALCLEELGECVPSPFSLEAELEAKELGRHLKAFIAGLPRTERRVFLSRYFYMLPVQEIAQRLGFSQSKVKSMLYRTRKKLLVYLREEELCPIQ